MDLGDTSRDVRFALPKRWASGQTPDIGRRRSDVRFPSSMRLLPSGDAESANVILYKGAYLIYDYYQ